MATTYQERSWLDGDEHLSSNLMRDKIFYAVCFGFLFGVLTRSFVFLGSPIVFLFLLISVSLVLFFALVSRNRMGLIIALACLAFVLGVERFHAADIKIIPLGSGNLAQEVSLTGKIIEDPDLRENNQQMVLGVEIKKQKIKILLSLGLEKTWEYGDVIQVRGKLEKPENFITDQGKPFDYVNYLRKDGILYVMRYPEAEIVSQGQGNIFKQGLFFIKHKLLYAVRQAVPYPENLLLNGLILGERSEFPAEMRQSFLDTGTIHIIALSGYNITVVSEWFMKMFYFLPQVWGIASGIFAIALFIIMTGAGATALRAGIMAGLALFAKRTGRNYDVGRALLLTATLMVFASPLILRHDVSFQLSFIATIAVVFLAPRIEKYFRAVPKVFGLREAITVSAAAYILVLPFVVYKMGNMSLVALPANFLILPFIPATMALGFLTSIAGALVPIVSLPLGFISSLFLGYELSVIKYLAKLPFAAVGFTSFPIMFTLLIYAWFWHKLFWRETRNLFTFEKQLGQNLPQ